ncbi:glycoside hydrolase family 32 protein [Petrocella sp. FN5]|uniref:glycoside hydrolase family 32 protein n=1 Tax=Petrocella sp. FN5 TaxID=3032002 RepID=UPI0023DC1707|nr:glycoside hydrolase family 32 protein [Petrocella sp. FN5]MDF1618300.1 glycoside hydrolase family 32 protein [Petrocella sp. FN5]
MNKHKENENNCPYDATYHFKPNRGWMNDPNGLIYVDGYYHMFFQHDQIDHVFKGMSWGHAVTKDFIHWEELEVAIKPDELGVIYSGCTIIDRHNHSGLGKDSILAFYTSTLPRQQQSMAYSLDNGKTFTKYQDNPIISNHPLSNIPDDFRDPKVIWHENTKKWIMLIAAFNRVYFWTSRDLIHWKKEHEFYDEMNKDIGVFECPDLFELPIHGNNTNGNKWVLLLSSNMGGINGETCTRYYTGDLQIDALGYISFIRDDQSFRIMDFGKDNYASITWSNVLDRTVLIGWMNNWEYAFQLPTKKWKGMMTLPRELSIQSFSGDLKLVSKPVAEIEVFFENGEYVMSDLVFPITPYTNISLYGGDEMNVAKAHIRTLDMTI